MHIYWTFNTIPELKGLAPEVQKNIWRSCYWKIYRHLPVYLSLMLLGLTVWTFGILGYMIVDRVEADEPITMIIMLISVGIGGGIGGSVFGQVATIYIRPYLREELLKLQANVKQNSEVYKTLF